MSKPFRIICKDNKYDNIFKRILELLMLAPGFVTVNEIMDYIYEDVDNEPYYKTIQVYIWQIRRYCPELKIKCIYSRGYMITNKPKVFLCRT